MDRIIKFRAWHRDIRVMLYPGDRFGTEHNLDCCRFFIEGQPLELMQFTGLHDKHGTEVYEGDVVRVVGAESGEMVVHVDDIAMMPVSTLYSAGKVIGNIYENPELLEKDNGNNGNHTD